MKRFVLALVAASATLGVSTSAHAQLWLKDRQATQGAGIRSGDFELHPGVAAEVGYDSNYFNRSVDKPFPVVDTVRLRITPQFYISTLGAQRSAGSAPPKVHFSAGAAFAYSQFLMNAGVGTGAERNKRLGRDSEWGILGDVAMNIAPGRPWGLNIYDNFQRTAQPSIDPLVEAGLNRIENRVAADVIHTRPGGLLDWRLGYAFGITYFENGPAGSTSVSPQDFNNYRHEVYTQGRWRFLPRTALVYNGSVWSQSYNTQTGGLSNSTPLRTRIGLSGLLTDRLSLLVMGGWGASFYANGGTGNRNFDSVIGQAELRYFLTGNAPEAGQPVATATSSSIALGFTRDFFNSYIGNYYERNRGYVTLNALFAQRFLVSVDAGFAGVRYADVLDRTTGQVLRTSFMNGRIDGTVFMEYRVKDWFGINATYQYLQEITNVTLRANARADAPRYGLEFTRHQAFVGMRVFF